ncbi:unnamed protein product [Acanthosepion pharaonis]|uniref:Uncharacterized protein n=1 Tax=Acanthosepion pharaonis TaxID=158019 RepID=A0A812DNH6_ACAPH|nr:unnamed protein product [Sepia pharaonis]
MQRTREYVAEQSAQLNSQPAAPQLVQSSALQHTRSPASQFDQPTNSEASFRYFPDPSEDHRRRCSTENRHDHSSDLMRYLPGPTLTILRRACRKYGSVWKKCYGSPEAIEDSLFERIHRFPKVTKDYDRLRELSDLLTELQAAKDDGDLPGLALLDTARGLRPIVEKLPPTLRDQWTSHGTTYKRKHQVPFPPFSVFTKFIEQQAEDRNDPSFRLTTDTWPSQNMDRTTTPQRKEISVHKTQIASKDIKEICPIHNLPHPLRSCRAFRSKPFPERQVYLRQHNICFRCCATHVNKDCRFKPKCAECGSESHNTALHPEPVPQTTPIRAMPNHGGENNDITAHCTQVCGSNLIEKSCSKICLVKVHPQGQRNKAVRMYAVIDEHSNKSLARPEFFELFSDHGPTSSYSLRTCAGVIETCADVPDNRAEIPTPDAALHHKHLARIAAEIPNLDQRAPILLLLGRDIIEVHKVHAQINGPHSAPYAQKLDMGWVIVGNVCLGGRINRPLLTPSSPAPEKEAAQQTLSLVPTFPSQGKILPERIGQLRLSTDQGGRPTGLLHRGQNLP